MATFNLKMVGISPISTLLLLILLSISSSVLITYITTQRMMRCGDGICERGENYHTCPQDCCEADCTDKRDLICHRECKGYNGCKISLFCDNLSKDSYLCKEDCSRIKCCGGEVEHCPAGSICDKGFCIKGICDKKTYCANSCELKVEKLSCNGFGDCSYTFETISHFANSSCLICRGDKWIQVNCSVYCSHINGNVYGCEVNKPSCDLSFVCASCKECIYSLFISPSSKVFNTTEKSLEITLSFFDFSTPTCPSPRNYNLSLKIGEDCEPKLTKISKHSIFVYPNKPLTQEVKVLLTAKNQTCQAEVRAYTPTGELVTTVSYSMNIIKKVEVDVSTLTQEECLELGYTWCEKCEDLKVNKWLKDICVEREDECIYNCKLNYCNAECEDDKNCQEKYGNSFECINCKCELKKWPAFEPADEEEEIIEEY